MLDEDDITVAHERTITDVIQGFPGITTGKVGAFGQATALYIRGAGIRYAVSSQVELYLRGENLTNNRTPQIFSANMPGVAVYGGFKLDF